MGSRHDGLWGEKPGFTLSTLLSTSSIQEAPKVTHPSEAPNVTHPSLQEVKSTALLISPSSPISY